MLTTLLLALAASSPASAQAASPTPEIPVEVQALPPQVQDANPTWRQTLERVVPAVVSLRVSATRPFDTEGSSNSVGTGFVVDAERGILLTNRHLTMPGPVTAEAVFLDNEEVDIHPIYRDPVHDFGFYRFDPAAVRFMEVVELPLYPAGAEVGVDIRLVGNDAGEKISILQSTLARLDRRAPAYGSNSFNDFNTFYYQAASGTSGGSSGSPVVDIKGRVIALNAGGRRNAASSYYLPLDRVVRALELVQAGEDVSRGTLQTVFQHRPFDELRRLGLDPTTEAQTRAAFPRGTGMLAVSEVVPAGPGDTLLRSGDVLVQVNGEPVVAFLPLEATLDDSVGETVSLTVDRGGESLTVELPVQDLHAITPSEYMEVGGAVLHALSYQQARNFSVPVQGLYVANPGYSLSTAGVSDGALIDEVAGQPVPDLDTLAAVLGPIPHGERVPVRFRDISDPRQDRVVVMSHDRLWFPMQRCKREDDSGFWPCEAIPEPDGEAAPVGGTTGMLGEGGFAARALAESLVIVDFDVPYRVEGVWGTNFRGTGLVVDAERGLVVVDRDTVPVMLGDTWLTFGGSVRVPGEVVFVHPIHDLTVLRYDPSLLGETPISAVRMGKGTLGPGDRVWAVGLDRNSTVVSRPTRIARIEPLFLPYPSPPKFRDSNIEVLELRDAPSSVGGAVTDRWGRVHALWASFPLQQNGEASAVFRGLPWEIVEQVLQPLREGREVDYRTLGVEWYPLTLADARERGLSDALAQQLEEHDPSGRQVLSVGRTTAGLDAATQLRGGDLLLAVDGQPVTRFMEVERATQKDQVELRILRGTDELTVTLGTLGLDGRGIERVVSWAGVLVHEPQLEIASQRGIERTGVYIAWYWYGSPAAQYGLRPTRRIVQVNETPTPDLDSFLAALGAAPAGEPVRLSTVDLDDQRRVLSIKPDPHYWPTWVFELGEDGWERSGL